MEKGMAAGSDLIMQSPTAIASDSMISPSPTLVASFTSHPSQPDIMPLLPSPIDTARRRRPSKGAASLPAIRRSASTPNVRGLTAGETAMSLAEKRRNKLGYHRTSVACVHCRKRKIRCLLAPDDPQNRCSNCIRLKKECKFYPVDQQPPVERRPRAGSGTEGLSAGNSTSSSSSPINGHVMESGHHFNPYPMLPLVTQTYSSSMMSGNGGIISPPSSIGPQSTRVFEFPPHHERPSWEPQIVDHPPLSAGHPYSDDVNGGLWKESPITPSYSPFTTGPPAALALQTRDFGTSYPPFIGQRHEPGWFPTRSMSNGHVEDLSHSYPTNYLQQYPTETRRRATVLYTPSLQTSNTSSNTSVSDMQCTPMSAPLSSSSMQQFALQPAWNSHPAPSPRTKLPDYGNWYPEPSQLANVQEEEVIPHFGREPAILYSSAGNR